MGRACPLCADEAVREAITTVFRRFDELGSARQVLIRLREDGVLLPRRRNGSKRIIWAQATYPAVHDFLTNPAYAGRSCSAAPAPRSGSTPRAGPCMLGIG